MSFSIFYRAFVPLVLFFGSLLCAEEVWPCSVCYSAGTSSRMAYYGTTLLMTLLPLALIAGLVWWLHRHHPNSESG